MATFNELELSQYDSAPVELFLFSNGEKYWAVTSADEDITIDLNNIQITASTFFSNIDINHEITFSSIPINRSNVTQSSELNKAFINITVPSTFEVASLLTFYPTSDIVAVTVIRYQKKAVAVSSNILIEFLGRVVSSAGSGITVDLRCEPITTSIKRMGLTQMYQRQCPHTLYSEKEGDCRAGFGAGGREAFGVVKRLTSVNGLILTFSSPLTESNKPLGFYNGGMIYWKYADYSYWRLILNQNSDTTLQINFPIPLFNSDQFSQLALENTVVN